MKLAATIVSVLAILGSAIWFYFERGFEPVITFLAGIAGLLWSISTPHTSPSTKQYIREFNALKARWNAEKDIKPPSVGDGRWLLGEALDFLSTIRTAKNTQKFYAEIDDLTRRVKLVQGMSICLDGGKSYAKFWEDGSQSLEDISLILNRI